jgi:hypothetical protein
VLPVKPIFDQAYKDDNSFIESFVSRVDRASRTPGLVRRAYRNQDEAQLNSAMEYVLSEQSQVSVPTIYSKDPTVTPLQILSQSEDLQSEDVQDAKKLTNLIMNITKRRLKPETILGRRFVDGWELVRSTARHDIYTSRFVTGETVAIKVLRNKINGKDVSTYIPVSHVI